MSDVKSIDLSMKRCLDVAIALPALIVSSPIQLAAALAIRISMGKPVVFRQERPGLNGRPFIMTKFRSMRAVDPGRGWTDDATRLTRVGKFIRATSIDELPTLRNVLRGDMSLVGPRPLKMEYLDRYTPEQARRHEVRPGLTGLAQVSGRNSLSWEERLALDVEYVDNRSLLLDLKLLLRTVSLVLKRDGISAEGHATMTDFMGTSSTSEAVGDEAQESPDEGIHRRST